MSDDRSSRLGSIATQLRSGARAYAAGAAGALAEQGGGDGSFALWHGFLTQRVLELAVAVEFDSPSLFAGEVSWSLVALEARSCSADETRAALRCLAASLEEDLPGSAWAEIQTILETAIREAARPTRQPDRLDVGDRFGGVALRFLEATLRGDARDAVDMLVGESRNGITIPDMYERVLMPAEAEIGMMWHRGEIGVAEEHAATETVRTGMSVLWHGGKRAEPNGDAVVVGAVADDRHDVGVRAASHLLELAGYRAACLGADVPAEEFTQAARDYEASAVVVSAMMGVHLPGAAETVRAIRAGAGEVRVIVGGPAFGLAEGLASRVGADGHARTLAETVELVGG